MPDATRDLPEVVVKAVDPTVEQLKVVSDSAVGCGEGAQVIVEAQNRWGFTATDPPGPVALILVGGSERSELGEVELTEGVGRAEVALPAAGIFRIEAETAGGLKAISDPIEVSETAGGPLLLWGDIHAHIRERRAQALISDADRLTQLSGDDGGIAPKGLEDIVQRDLHTSAGKQRARELFTQGSH